MIVEYRRNTRTTGRVKPKHSETTLSHCHFFHPKSPTDSPGIACEPSRWEAGDKPPQRLYDRGRKELETVQSFLCLVLNSTRRHAKYPRKRRGFLRIACLILGKWPNWHTGIFYVFISILYMFRATSCSSSGESIVSIQPLVYVTLCRWPFGVHVSDLHTKRSPTHSDKYQMLYWYNWFSWRWARGCSKHVENWNKYIENTCVSIWSFTKN